MSRLFVTGRLSIGVPVQLTPQDTHYLRDVLRLGRGDSVILVDGSGSEFRAGISPETGRDLVLTVLEKLPPRPRPTLTIRLFAGLMKGKKMERLIRDAADLGIESFNPFISSRTIPRDIGDMKFERMKKIALDESRLSGRNRALLVNPPVPFGEAIRVEGGLRLILWEEECQDIRNVLKGCDSTPDVVSIFTGPEGGFSADEVMTARDAGIISAGLGSRILRAQIAPLVAAAIIQYEWGDI